MSKANGKDFAQKVRVVMAYWEVEEHVASQYVKAWQGGRRSRGRHMAEEAISSANMA